MLSTRLCYKKSKGEGYLLRELLDHKEKRDREPPCALQPSLNYTQPSIRLIQKAVTSTVC